MSSCLGLAIFYRNVVDLFYLAMLSSIELWRDSMAGLLVQHIIAGEEGAQPIRNLQASRTDHFYRYLPQVKILFVGFSKGKVIQSECLSSLIRMRGLIPLLLHLSAWDNMIIFLWFLTRLRQRRCVFLRLACMNSSMIGQSPACEGWRWCFFVKNNGLFLCGEQIPTDS